jgi:RNA polymerase sigma-70 factor, ECF subfamily
MSQPLYMDDVDEQRVASLYQQHAPGIFTYLRLHLRSREDAEDVLAEVFLRSFENASFRQLAEPQQRLWLWRVARNKLADYYRVAARRQTVDLAALAEEIYDDEELSPERLAERGEEYLRLSAALRELSPTQQQILRLRLVNGLRCVDIAHQLNKSEGAIRTLISRTLNLLRSIYTQQEGKSYD